MTFRFYSVVFALYYLAVSSLSTVSGVAVEDEKRDSECSLYVILWRRIYSPHAFAVGSVVGSAIDSATAAIGSIFGDTPVSTQVTSQCPHFTSPLNIRGPDFQ